MKDCSPSPIERIITPDDSLFLTTLWGSDEIRQLFLKEILLFLDGGETVVTLKTSDKKYVVSSGDTLHFET